VIGEIGLLGLIVLLLLYCSSRRVGLSGDTDQGLRDS
jgi:hypothetical protein